jgi:adenosylhomocysteine nucleosidase
MPRLVIKTGMAVEDKIVRRFAAPDAMCLTGSISVDDLDKMIGPDCEAIISVGVCGGLSPFVQVGQAVICSTLLTPNGQYVADPAWRERLFAATKYYEVRWWSSGAFNTANTVLERRQLCGQTGCKVIDDETVAVAEFAKRRGIAFQALRTVSDGAEDNLPPAVLNALNADGSDNIWNVVKSVVTDPEQIPALVKTAIEAKKSYDELRTACLAVGSEFQWH